MSESTPSKLVHHAAQYGALGIVCACFLAATGWLLYTLTPVWVDYFQAATSAQRSQTELIRQTRTAIQDISVQLRNGNETMLSEVSRMCSRRPVKK